MWGLRCIYTPCKSRRPRFGPEDNASSLFNWYVTADRILCGDLCIHNMRQAEYVRERMAYVRPAVTLKRDRKHRAAHPGEYRYHEFMRWRLVGYDAASRVARVRDADGVREVVLVNMDAFFFLHDGRRQVVEARVQAKHE